MKPGPSPILEISSVFKRYASIAVLKGVTLSVTPGQSFAVLGPNGAGKTTLFKCLTGETFCDSGTVAFEGRDITRLLPHERTRLGMARTFQVARVFRELSAIGNVIASVEARFRTIGQQTERWYAYRPSRQVTERAEALLVDLGLAHCTREEARFLSHGDKKRLEFAIALALEPKILLLDEPTAGMSPSERQGIVDLIKRIRASRPVTIVMTEHDMDVIFSLADRLMVLNYGEVIAEGSLDEVRNNAQVQDVYLGRTMIHA